MAMLRYNASKPKVDLVPWAFIEALILPDDEHFTLPTYLIEDVAHVLDFGSRKYAAHNWRKGGPWSEVWACGMRHILKYLRGETHDEESGLHHMAHLATNIAFLLEFIAVPRGIDDRFKLLAEIDDIAESPGGLRTVFYAYMAWRDGGETGALADAAYYLADWYDTLEDSERAIHPGTSPFAPIQVTRQ